MINKYKIIDFGIGGSKLYCVDDKFHREDGPAVELFDGEKLWFKHGQLHREDGPAVESANGKKEWWLNGNRHRDDGPAIEWYGGDITWYLNDEYYGYNDDFTNESWKRFIKTIIFS